MYGVKKHAVSSLIWQLPSAVAFIDCDFKIQQLTKIWSLLFEVTKNSLIGTDIASCLPGNEVQNHIIKSFEGNETSFNITISISKDEQDILIKSKPWYDDQTEVIIGAIIEICDTYSANLRNQEHKELKNLLKVKSKIAQIGSWEMNPATNKIILCDIGQEILGDLNGAEIDFNEFINLFKAGYSQNKISMLLFALIEKGLPFSEELELAEANSKHIIINAMDFSGKILGTIQDITTWVEKEQRINEKENLINALIDNIPTSIYVKDKSLKKVLVNKAECEFFGVQDKYELIGNTDFDLFGEHFAKHTMNQEMQIFKTAKPILNKHEEITKKNGSVVHFLTSKIPLINIHGEVYSILGIGVDITSLKEKEVELKRLINVTSVQNKKLLKFSHIISHNLRSHTSNFAMLLDFLTQEKDQEEKDKIVQMLVSSSDGLTETMNTLNTVTSVKSELNLKVEKLNLYSIIDKVLESLNTIILKNEVTLHNKVNESITVNAIEDYLEDILTNLITNAIKYRHPDRQPKIILTFEKKDNKSLLTIKDNGSGIDLNRHGNKLFNMYKTFHDRPDARGIGLFINKNQAEAMGCDILVESKKNLGSNFSICFNE